ncbi:beta-ketoacyl synthase N-terminal-like domain-containing protein [Amycolatopsis suaedae]|uniref:Beta-ketoacyl synthase n=1 Tax=Amycolatopsis suaedae TaxID=2510978 RepID=A0A4Q7J4Y8_9PSEU|nr:beta-ketoacyl synthase N-terminal-like domain-containing protein [Amycolatopsis suaedae]RZQ61094.1 beta-ketoacyl synthase [Amycolatopsis suaedae]
MSPLLVTGWSAVTSAGVGVDAVGKHLALAGTGAAGPADVTDLGPGPLPVPAAHALVDFSAREHLGRKGTSTYDRVTGLAVVCCQEALREAGTTVDDGTRRRIGVVLGTTLGSFRSTSDYSAETLTQDKPYLVNPMLFPNTVMNCAAGQMAIRFGLRGVNATIAGGPLAMLNVLRYAGNVLDRGYADAVVAGAAEEFTAHRAWAAHLGGGTVAGEAAGMFVLTRPGTGGWAGRRARAEVAAVATGYSPGAAGMDRALAACAERALRRAAVDPATVTTVVTGERDSADRTEYGAVLRALGTGGRAPRRLLATELFGDCGAASGAVALAALLTGDEPGVGLVTARGADGAVGAAVVRRYADGGTDRG